MNNKWFRKMLEADSGANATTGGAGAENEADPFLSFVPGGDLLTGAKTEVESVDEWEEPDEWPDPYAEAESDETSDEPEEKPEEKEEPDREEEPENKEEIPEKKEDQPEKPEWYQKRLDQLTAQRGEIERERDTLKGELAQLRATREVPVLPPTEADPIANIESFEQLQAIVQQAEAVKAWAQKNWEGGECTLFSEEPEILDAEQARLRYWNAEAMLNKHVPRRAQYLSQFNDFNAAIKREYPEYMDPSTPEGQRLIAYAKDLPEVKKYPHWQLALIDLDQGRQMRIKKAEKKNGKTKTEDAPEIAPPMPGSPRTGARAALTSQKPVKTKQLKASMTVEELAALL